MKKIICLFLTLMIQNVFASDCVESLLKEKSDDGSILITMRGNYMVDLIDRIYTSLWLPLERVMICDNNTIINLRSEKTVKVSRID